MAPGERIVTTFGKVVKLCCPLFLLFFPRLLPRLLLLDSDIDDVLL